MMAADIYTCFIASPSDTQAERDACERVFDEINMNLGHFLNFRLEAWKWEKNARPSFGKDGQDIINNQVGDSYQIFIGIMHGKFGSPTPRAGSGTAEEFDIAYTRFTNKEDVEIMIYFNNEPIPFKDIKPLQLEKVQEFRKKVADLGGLYWEYNGVSDFESNLKKHLYNFFYKKKEQGQLKAPQLADNSENNKSSIIRNSILAIFERNLNNSLHNFSTQPTIWVEPVLGTTNEISRNADSNFDNRVSIEAFIASRKSTVIKAPPQFGLTCLAYYLIKEAWIANSLWIYIDSTKVKVHSIAKIVAQESVNLGLSSSSIDCIVLDSCSSHNDDFVKKVNNLIEAFPTASIVIMQTIDVNAFNNDVTDAKLKINFDVLHLLALPRTQIRRIVSAYNNAKGICDENRLLSKVILDLDVLNIHRTPMNCLTLLKVSERNFDESPVNRTRMLELVLTDLFETVSVPNYKSKPDVKDCEFVLGRFCESIIRNNKYSFLRDDFLKELRSFCTEKLIELDVDVMFDLLTSNSIITQNGFSFSFRFSYWVFYFAAKRMHSEQEFNDYIFEDDRYISFPELVEFYTGIDRNRADALSILTKRIRETREVVREKVGLPDTMNPFRILKWNPTEEAITKMQKGIGEDVIGSKLPEVVKDQYADNNYDQLKPYNQEVRTIMRDYSLLSLMSQITACSRALRNSDYVKPELKRELLHEIIKSWEEVTKVCLALTPIIASKGFTSFQGVGFIWAGDTDAPFEDKVYTIIDSLSFNVVEYFKDDLFSNKLGPLLYDRAFSPETTLLGKHQLMLTIAVERPKGWRNEVEKYIVSIDKNSFYLANILQVLMLQYSYAFVESSSLRDIEYLMRMCLAKHQFGDKKPGLDKLRKVPTAALPKRAINEEES
jgi:hypothetical protein